MVISGKDKEAYAEQGFLILRKAFAQTRIEALLEGIERLIDKGLAGECEIGWIDRERRLPSRTGHLLNPDKYHPAFADWIDEDLAPHLEGLDLRSRECATACSACSPSRRREAVHPEMAPRPRQTR